MVLCYSNLNKKNETCLTPNTCIAMLHQEKEKNSYSCNFGDDKNTLCNHWSDSRDGIFYLFCCTQDFCNNVTLHSLIENISSMENSTFAQPPNKKNWNAYILSASAILIFLLCILSLLFLEKHPIATKSFKDYVELLTIIGNGRYGK
ncbi:hypothetical protein MXB_2015, partial [Myxobolus squamalis]